MRTFLQGFSLVLAAEHHLKIYPGVRDHAAIVAQFVKKSSLVISIYSQSKCKNIVDPDQLASPKPAYLDLQCLQRQDITIYNMVYKGFRIIIFY